MSAKTRTGPPSDDDGDLDWPTWAGIVPLASGFGVPAPAEGIDAERALPAALRAVDR
jgi:hypothetical protein